MIDSLLIISAFIIIIGTLVFINYIPRKKIFKALTEYIDDDSSTLVEVNKLGIKEILRYSSVAEMLSFFIIYGNGLINNYKKNIYRKAEIKTHSSNSTLVYFKIRVKFKAILEIEIIDSFDF